MRILFVSPDYASHWTPMSALALELTARGHDVAVATGPTLAPRVRRDGLEHRELRLGPGSNGELARPEAQPPEEAVALRRFLDATREGMVAALRHQAQSRLRDLLWEPNAVTARLAEILREDEPDLVVSDQLAFGATLALRALEQPFVSFHPGHPSAIPGPGELFGFPVLRPRELPATEDELTSLWELCDQVSERFTRTFNRTLRELNPAASRVVSALSATSPLLTLLNYPEELGGHRRALLPRTARFVGASVRGRPSGTCERGRTRIYASLGTFLSARGDVLARIADAFRRERVDLVLAHGVTPREALGDLPERWRVERFLPQQELLGSCDLAITHGGNNSVTEALWAGVPLLVCPLSTDQFAGAEDVRRVGLGDVFDPNHARPTEIAARARTVLASAAPSRAEALSRRLQATAGPPLAATLLERLAVPEGTPTVRAR